MFEVDEVHRLGTGEDLFDFLAGCVQSFLREKHPSGRHLELGQYRLFTIYYLLCLQKCVCVRG